MWDSFHISTLQREDPVCITLHSWIVAGEFPPWAEVKSMLPELSSLWHHRNNLLTTMALCGAREVHRAHFYSYWSLRPVANNCSCLTMLPYLVAIWAGPETWLGCHITSIGRACRTTLKNGWVSVWRVSRGSPRWAATTPWEISPFRLMMGEECSLPQDVSTAELRTSHENDVAPHPFATWVRDALEFAFDHVCDSLQRTAARRKQLYDTKAVNRKFPVGSWVLCYYPPAAQHKLGSPWIGPHQVVRQATGHTVGIQRDSEKPIVFVHVDDLKLCPGPQDISWVPSAPTAKSLCASTVAF